jgi:hypothetical protein
MMRDIGSLAREAGETGVGPVFDDAILEGARRGSVGARLRLAGLERMAGLRPAIGPFGIPGDIGIAE